MKRVCTIASLLLISVSLFATTFTLNDGSTITGTIQNETVDAYQVLVTIPKSSVIASSNMGQTNVSSFTKPVKKTPTVPDNFEVIQGAAVSAPINMDRFAVAASNALAAHGYRIISSEPGIINYKLAKSNYSLTMRLCYAPDEYWYEYVDSYNLDANPYKDKIHKNYYKWIQILEKELAKNY